MKSFYQRIQLRVTIEEKELAETKAKKKGLTLSEYIRGLIRQK